MNLIGDVLFWTFFILSMIIVFFSLVIYVLHRMWLNKNYLDPDILKDLLDSGGENHLLVDVRTESEYEAGHIPGAIQIPHDDLPAALPVGTGMDQTIILYCRTGSRAGFAAKDLKRAGYSNVQNFGGIYRWPYALE